MTPELHRPLKIDTVGSRPVVHEIKSTADERLALTRRFGLIAIDALTASVTVDVRDGTIHAQGSIKAKVTQSCVASALPVPAKVAENFHIRFSPLQNAGEEEVELNADDCDEMTHDGQSIDIGEAIAQSLALALDPWPRARDADDVLKAAGVLGEGEAGPFAALKGLSFKGNDA